MGVLCALPPSPPADASQLLPGAASGDPHPGGLSEALLGAARAASRGEFLLGHSQGTRECSGHLARGLVMCVHLLSCQAAWTLSREFPWGVSDSPIFSGLFPLLPLSTPLGMNCCW